MLLCGFHKLMKEKRMIQVAKIVVEKVLGGFIHQYLGLAVNDLFEGTILRYGIFQKTSKLLSSSDLFRKASDLSGAKLYSLPVRLTKIAARINVETDIS